MTEQPEIEIDPEKLTASLRYAQERAKATGRPYLVTPMGHALLDCKLNRPVAEECGGVAFVAKSKEICGPIEQVEPGLFAVGPNRNLYGCYRSEDLRIGEFLTAVPLGKNQSLLAE